MFCAAMARRSDSWQTKYVADWLPREPAPLAEVVGKKTKVVGSFQRAVKTVVVSSSQRHGNIALAECLKVLCLLRLDYMQWPYPSLI